VRPTIAEVATQAGVSIATVSRALRNLPGVADLTRERVVATATELGYVMAPMPIGRSVGLQRRIAVVVPQLNTWFFGSVVGALVSQLAEFGLLTELHMVGNAADRNAFFACAPLRRRVSGVAVVGLSVSSYELASLTSLNVPLVGVHTNLPAPNVAVDDAGMSRLAVDHLVGLGHTRIAMIVSVPGAPASHVVPQGRSRGYQESHRDAGLPIDPTLMLCGEDTVQGGARAMSLLLARSRLPTAVFVHSDEMAFGALSVLRGAGLQVPGDVSVISIDDNRLASAFQLTTVAQDVEAQGRGAAELLARSIGAGRNTRPMPPMNHQVPKPYLVIRGTTAPPSDLRSSRSFGLSSVPPGGELTDRLASHAVLPRTPDGH
jgi:LacI family repressor for deo operon, udp, cdd, tsx, nupC, and nupG